MWRHIVPYATDDIIQTLRNAREHRGLSQRDLSARIGVPQSHISKIESGATDLRLSSLVEFARALDYELVLVPRKLVPAVEAIVSNAPSAAQPEDARLRSSALHRARATLAKLNRVHSETPELKRLDQTLRELANSPLGKSEIDTIRQTLDRLTRLPSGPRALSAIQRASQQLSELRSRIAQAVPDAPRPAYALDEEDEDA
jgi:transcriptional regulator with XRE-family HTH domain